MNIRALGRFRPYTPLLLSLIQCQARTVNEAHAQVAEEAGLRSCRARHRQARGVLSAARAALGMSARHERGIRANNRVENSHQPVRRRERKMQPSSRRGQPSDSCPFIPPPTTTSMSTSATSSPDPRSGFSEPRRCNIWRTALAYERCRSPGQLRPTSIPVTMPLAL